MEDQPYNPKKTNSVSDTRYKGKICTKHPKEEGLRYKRNSGCVWCQKTANARLRKLSRPSFLQEMKRQTRIIAERMARIAGGTSSEWERFEAQAQAIVESVKKAEIDGA